MNGASGGRLLEGDEVRRRLQAVMASVTPTLPPESVLYRRGAARRRRRRVLLTGIAVPSAAALSVVGLTFADTLVRHPDSTSGSTVGQSATAAAPARSSATQSPSAVTSGVSSAGKTRPPVLPHPTQPGALAAAPGGGLYVADPSTNEIYEMSGAGTFTVVAGTGNAGSSGDGGPANQAELNDPTGLALASDGTLYIADRGNNRVRAVKSDGTIETVAGNGMANPGRIGLGGDATQTAIAEPTAIATAPDGLYIAAANQVLKVGAGGVVSQALGPVQFRGADPRFPQSSECDPSAVAVDAAGDVYVACANTKYLLVRQASGAIRFLGAFAAEKATSTLAQLLDGTVVGVDGGTIIRLSDASRTVAATVGQVGSLSYFEPQGIAGASLQSLYVDQDGASGKGPAAIAQGSLTNLTLRWQTPT